MWTRRLAVLAAAGCCVTASLAASGRIYRFDARADALVRLYFPTRVLPATVLESYAQRDRAWEPRNLTDVLQHNVAVEHASGKEPAWIRVDDDPLESFFFSRRECQRVLEPRFVERARRLLAALAAAPSAWNSVLEKALFQRDLFHIHSVVHAALERSREDERERDGQAVLDGIARLWPRVLLSPAEYAKLRGSVPHQADARRFAAEYASDSRRDYLPARVLGPAPGWQELPFAIDETQHFKTFRGRSFIRVFIRMPGMSVTDLQRYWTEMHAEFGARLPVEGGSSPLPAGTETLLLRTFGVFLEDGRFADSHWPEEVLMRIFKHGTQRLDPSTSDQRGTALYQYKLSRRRLLAQPSSLGLRRIADDDPSFVGFLREAPDAANTTGEAMSTMRYNCIACHSGLLYGAHTVFSLAAEPRRDSAGVALASGMIHATGDPDLYRLDTPEYRALVERVASAAEPRRPRLDPAAHVLRVRE
ncbi:MAG TPA: hypothetical protein VJS92_12125 [Candidatus Polarisedimenticolaceae bacterium]|nr:hypothetical protein [Candidatus Polarisedimenticolaceae bacterium]